MTYVSENFWHDAVNKAIADDWVASRCRTIGDTVEFSREGRELKGKIVDQDDQFY